MPYLTAAVILLAVLTVTNLVLVLGIVSRLREHARLLADRPAAEEAPVVLPAGATVGHFASTDVDGRPVTRESVELAGFFSPRCGACSERVPDFLRYAASAGHSLAVVVGEPAEAAELVGLLSGSVAVTVEPEDGPVATAFAVRGFPAFCLVGDDGDVLASGYDVADLPVPTLA